MTTAARGASPWTQLRVLTARQLACLGGDRWATLLLVAQAPLLGWLCGRAWGDGASAGHLDEALAVVAFWIGTLGAAREIVGERRFLERERQFGLHVPTYVASKVLVLSAMALGQVGLLLGAAALAVREAAPPLAGIPALWAAAVAGTGLGLLVSAGSSRRAVALLLVPLVVLPQAALSELALPAATLAGPAGLVARVMPASWAAQAVDALSRPDGSVGAAVGGPVALLALGAALAGLAVLVLRGRAAGRAHPY